LNQYKKLIKASMIEGQSPAIEAAKNELEKGLKGLLGSAIPQVDIINESGVLLAGVYKTSTIFQKLDLKKDLKKIGDEGFIIKNTVIDGKVYDL
jgi:alpha-glucuronidase